MKSLMSLFRSRRTTLTTTLVFEDTDLRFLTARGGRVEEWGSVTLPTGLVSQGLVTNPREMGRVIDELFTGEDLERGQVITSLSGLRSTARVLTMPRLPASQLRQAVAREARREMPVPIATLYLSWQTLSETGNQQRIYVLGVPQDLIDAQVRALEAADVPPYVMDLKPLALVRAVNQRVAIIANLERDEMGIAVVADRVPALMRVFSLATETLDEVDKIDRLVLELRQTVAFHNDSRQGLPMGPEIPVYVTGRVFDDKDAFAYLVGAMDRSVERPPPPIPCPDELPLGGYATNLGLVMKKA